MAIKMANNDNIKKRIYAYTVIHSSNKHVCYVCESVEPNWLVGMKVFSLTLLKELYFFQILWFVYVVYV